MITDEYDRLTTRFIKISHPDNIESVKWQRGVSIVKFNMALVICHYIIISDGTDHYHSYMISEKDYDIIVSRQGTPPHWDRSNDK